MSVICDYMIVADLYNENDAVGNLNKALYEIDEARHQQFRKIDMDHAGGSKYYTTDVWAAAFNHLALTDIDDAIRAAPWKYPETVLVVVSGPDYDIDLHARTVAQMRVVTA